MLANLNYSTRVQIYADAQETANPSLRAPDWARTLRRLVSNPRDQGFDLAAGETQTLFSGLRATTLDGTSAFSLALSPLDASRYRLTWTAGTNPGFRQSRNLTLSGQAVTIAPQANATVLISVVGPTTWGSVVAGDTIFIPHVTTGDAANVFSVLNAGFWLVLAVVNAQTLSLARFPAVDFEATGETQILTNNNQLQAFSSSGVQPGDYLDITAGFASSVLRTFNVVAVTSSWVEFLSTSPLPPQTGVTPGAAGMIFYLEAKSFFYLESDQEASVSINANPGIRLSPLEPGNGSKPAVLSLCGPVWSLAVTNRSQAVLRGFFISAE